MRVLVLGGTGFLGRHFVEAAISRGHALTLFNRGRSAAGLFPGIEQVHGDRTLDLDRLGDGKWDAVVDTCAYRPAEVSQALSALAHRIGLYLFISTISVYRDFRQSGMKEDAPVAETVPGLDRHDEHLASALEITGATYGPLKAWAERIVRDHCPERHLIIRPGVIVGPFDPRDRFVHWVRRVEAGGRMAVPGRPADGIQFIDVRDLAAFMVRLLETGTTGTIHASGPTKPFTHADMMSAMAAGLRDPAEPVWIDPGEAAAGRPGLPPAMRTWMRLNDEFRNLMSIDLGKAVSLGLVTRPPEKTVQDVREWLAASGSGGTDPETLSVEEDLLKAVVRRGNGGTLRPQSEGPMPASRQH